MLWNVRNWHFNSCLRAENCASLYKCKSSSFSDSSRIKFLMKTIIFYIYFSPAGFCFVFSNLLITDAPPCKHNHYRDALAFIWSRICGHLKCSLHPLLRSAHFDICHERKTLFVPVGVNSKAFHHGIKDTLRIHTFGVDKHGDERSWTSSVTLKKRSRCISYLKLHGSWD